MERILIDDEILWTLLIHLPSFCMKSRKLSKTIYKIVNDERLEKLLPSVFEHLDLFSANPFEICTTGTVDELWLMLVHGLNIKVRDSDSATLIQKAVYSVNPLPIMSLLIEQGCSVNSRGAHGYTPLHEACYTPRVDVAQFLLRCKGNVDALSQNGSTPLMIACRNGNLEMVELLLRDGQADPDDGGERGWTPLLLACIEGHTQVVKVLLEYGADPNYKLPDQSTVIHEAVQTNQLDVLKQLIKSKANLAITDEQGRTPLDLAQETGNHKATSLLYKVKPRKIQNHKQVQHLNYHPLAASHVILRGRALPGLEEHYEDASESQTSSCLE